MHREIIRQFKSERKKQKKTQQDVSDNCKLNISTVNRMERGESIPTLETFTEAVSGIGFMIVIIPVPQNLPIKPEPKEEEIVEEEPPVNYDNWNYGEGEE